MATRSIRSLPSLARTIAPASPYAATTSYAVGSPYSRRQFPTSDLRTLRPFSSSSASFASEAPKDPFEHRASWQSEVPLFERLQNHPECMEAIERLAETVKRKTGVNLTSGEAPSMSMMYKLATDEELRSCAEQLMSSLKNAGIEVDPKAAFKALSMMGGEGFGNSKDLSDLHEAMRRGEEEENGNGKKGGKK